MAEGTSTFEGLSLPRLGEYEQVQQDPTIDMVTLTGSTGQTGDFFVCQDCSGTEVLSVAVGGAITVGSSITGTQQTLVVSATTMMAGLTVSITSTGAIDDGQITVNGVVVQASSKSVLGGAFVYNSAESTNASTVSNCNYLLGTMGTTAPTYFLSIATTLGPLKGAHGAMEFLDDSLLVNTFTCDHPFVGLKCMNGSAAFYLLGVRATGIT